MLPLMRPFTVSPETAGECVVRIAEDGKFGVKRVPKEGNGRREELAIGSDGVRASGVYAVDMNGKRKIKDGLMRGLREKGARVKVWEFCMGVFKRVGGETGGQGSIERNAGG
ncbi:hypothetical protein BCR34DRAFT_555160 [Clohesyomyces aquaticus]|uniref:Uncharacterized protein n=1 Tax=Clohesyomyces aquaticus TaxID=1231657 RepID=A0A1Y2A503_9PLEO|nr:hypothetical protein BCR34DRAFT_555160 [Clohesyomyces aquaticus]